MDAEVHSESYTESDGIQDSDVENYLVNNDEQSASNALAISSDTAADPPAEKLQLFETMISQHMHQK